MIGWRECSVVARDQLTACNQGFVCLRIDVITRDFNIVLCMPAEGCQRHLQRGEGGNISLSGADICGWISF